VLGGATRGYTRHPQLERFRGLPVPLEAVGAYLAAIADEAEARGYRFDRGRIASLPAGPVVLAVETGQLDYEWRHLMRKLEVRSPDVAARWAAVLQPDPHPLFTLVEGPVASWERPAGSSGGPPSTPAGSPEINQW
jgi:hypothetical protein